MVGDVKEISKNSYSQAFRGNFSYSIDEKGRLSLPVEFRTVIASSKDDSVVLTNYICDGARCLEGFSLSAWQNFENRLRAKSRFDSKLQKLENFYFSRASQCFIDSAGRILVPEYLRTYAGLSKQVTISSSIHGFRLWDTRVWDLVFSTAEGALLANPDLFMDVDL